MVGGKLNELANDQNKVNSSGKQSASGVDALNGAIGKLGGLIAAAQAASFVADLYDIGNASEVARSGLEAMVGTKADLYINAVRDSVGGTISDMDAATVANRALAFGFASNAEEAANFTRVATILGKTFQNLGAADAAQQLGLLLSNMSVLRLDTFGISGGKVKARIEELQAATAGLSREAAFKQAFWEEAIPAADRYAGVLDSNSAKADQLAASWQNLQASAGELVSDGLTPAVEGANNLVGGINDVNEAVKTQRESLLNSTTTFGDFIKQAGQVPFLMYEIRAAQAATADGEAKMAALRTEWQAHRDAVLASAKAMASSTAQAEMMQAQQDNLKRSIEGAATATQTLVGDLDAYSQALDRNAQFQLSILSGIDQITTAKGGEATIYDFASSALERYGVTGQQALVMTEELGLATGQLTQRQIEQTAAVSELTNLWGQGLIGAQTYAEGMRQIQQGADAAAVSTQAQHEAVQALAYTMISQGVPASEALARAQEQVSAAAEGTPETIDSLRAKVDDLNSIVASMTQPQKLEFTSTAGEEYNKVQTLIDAVNAESALAPAPISFPNNAVQETEHVSKLHAEITALDGATATVFVNVQQSGEIPSPGNLPGNQSGTPFFPGGQTVVGEGGPEIVDLPRGSRIRSNPDSRNFVSDLAEQAAGNGDTFIITGPVYISVPDKGGITDIMQQIATVRK